MQSLRLLSAAKLAQQHLVSRASHSYVRTPEEVAGYLKSAKLWGAMTFVVAFPCIAFGFYNMEKREHEFHESHPDGPALPNWEWNRITKPFPWGNGKQPLFEHLFQKHQDIYPKD